MSFDVADFLQLDTQLIGTVITSGAAGSQVELELASGLRVDHRAIGDKHNTRQHNGIRVTFPVARLMDGALSAAISSPATPTSAPLPFGAVVQVDPCQFYATVGTYETGESGFCWVYSADGLVSQRGSVDMLCYKPFVAAFFGNSPTIRKELPL